MNEANPPQGSPAFPIEAQFTFTEDIVRMSNAAFKDVVSPKWIQILLPVALGLQLLVQLPGLVLFGSPTISLSIVVLLLGVYGAIFWRRRKKKALALRTLVGTRITVRFFSDGLDFGEATAAQRIVYSRVYRAGRDDRGIVLLVHRMGGLFIPTTGFGSPEQRDLVFVHLSSVMKQPLGLPRKNGHQIRQL